MDPSELMRRMKEEEGLALKQSILGHRIDPTLPNQVGKYVFMHLNKLH